MMTKIKRKVQQLIPLNKNQRLKVIIKVKALNLKQMIRQHNLVLIQIKLKIQHQQTLLTKIHLFQTQIQMMNHKYKQMKLIQNKQDQKLMIQSQIKVKQILKTTKLRTNVCLVCWVV